MASHIDIAQRLADRPSQVSLAHAYERSLEDLRTAETNSDFQAILGARHEIRASVESLTKTAAGIRELIDVGIGYETMDTKEANHIHKLITQSRGTLRDLAIRFGVDGYAEEA